MSKAGKSDSKIASFEESHEFLKDNEFIQHGYRLHFNSSKKILRSLFMFHNESFNVWSHLFGVAVFIILFAYTIFWLGTHVKLPEFYQVDDFKHSLLSSLHGMADSAHRYEEIIEHQFHDICNDAYNLSQILEQRVQNIYEMLIVENTTEKFKPLLEKFEELMKKIDSKQFNWIDFYNDDYVLMNQIHRWPIFVFISSAIICMLFSSIYHLFSAHSQKLNRSMSTLDYAGISTLIAGSFYPPIFYAFYCFPGNRNSGLMVLYLGMMTFASVITFIISFVPSFQHTDMRWFRSMIFAGLAFVGLVPIIHLLFLPQSREFLYTAWYFGAESASYLLGVAFYVSRVPERYYPGKFDLIGHSHNIWHLFVIIAALFHYFGCLEVYHLRMQLECIA